MQVGGVGDDVGLGLDRGRGRRIKSHSGTDRFPTVQRDAGSLPDGRTDACNSSSPLTLDRGPGKPGVVTRTPENYGNAASRACSEHAPGRDSATCEHGDRQRCAEFASRGTGPGSKSPVLSLSSQPCTGVHRSDLQSLARARSPERGRGGKQWLADLESGLG